MEAITTQEKPIDKVLSFVESKRDVLETVALRSIKFIPNGKAGTFSINLLTGDITLSPRFFKDPKLDDNEKADTTLFAVLHEIGHSREVGKLLEREDGEKKYGEYLDRLKKGDRGYNLFNNIINDFGVNASVSAINPNFKDVERLAYQKSLYKNSDYRKMPKHIQFLHALAREHYLPDEACQVDPLVREKLDQVKAIELTIGGNKFRLVEDILSFAGLDLEKRIMRQDRYIWPVVEELRKLDIEEKKNKPKKKGKDNKKKKNEDEEDDGETEEENNNEVDSEEGEGDEDTDTDIESYDSGSDSDEDEGKDGGSDTDEADPNETDPNKLFKKYYDNPEGMPSVDPEELDKEFKEWKKENGKEAKERKAEEERIKKKAEELGVKPEVYKEFEDIVNKLRNTRNPETQRELFEELQDLLSRVISRRTKEKRVPKYPVGEGLLIDPAGAIIGVKSGKLDLDIFEDEVRREVQGDLFGEVEVTVVADRSGSMKEPLAKLVEQKRAVTFLLKAIEMFNDELRRVEGNLKKPLKIFAEVYSFQSSEEDKKPILSSTEDITDRACIDVMTKISTVEGSTTDFVTLKAIRENLSPENLQKIKDSELKKIIVVFTDGESNDKSEVQKEIKLLTDLGVVICGVGITESGKPALTTYAPNAKVAEKAEGLTAVLANLLQEHLRGV